MSCAPSPNVAPKPESDSSQEYITNAEFGIPVDDEVYVITGEVVGDVSSLVQQSEPARGSMSGSTFSGTGAVSGSYFGPQFDGKGFVRLYVHNVLPAETAIVSKDQIAIIKTSDTKASALLPGDIVTFVCRQQYEALAAVRDREIFDESASVRLATWELDYCRLKTPAIQVGR